MANILLATPKLSDTGTFIRHDGEVAGYEAEYMLNMQPSLPFRTSDTTPQFTLDFGSAVRFNWFGLFATNLSVGAWMKIHAGSTTAATNFSTAQINLGTTVGDSDDADFSPRNWHYKFNSQNYRYWRVELADLGNPDGYIQIGRFMADVVIQPAINHIYGSQLTFIDPAEKTTTKSGAIIPTEVEGGIRRSYRFALDGLTEAEYISLMKRDYDRGASKDVFICEDIDNDLTYQLHSIHGLMRELEPGIIARPGNFQYTKRFEVEELK